MRKGNIASVQVLRGIAALLVVLYHGTYLMQYRLETSNEYFWFGYSGVDIFFVLSGFIIYFTSYNKLGLLSAKEFFLRRLARIFPLYWVAMASILVIFFVGKNFINGQSSIIDSIQNGGVMPILKAALLIPRSSEMIGVAWTLSFELCFYMLFAFLFFRSRKIFMGALIFWASICWTMALFFHTDFSGSRNPVIALMNPIMTEFLFGCVVAILFLKYEGKFWKTSLLAGMILFSIAALTLKSTLFGIPTQNQLPRIFVYGFPAALILYGAVNIKSAFPKLLTYLGDASYSIYLFHYPILGILVKLTGFLHIHAFARSHIGKGLLYIALLTICCLIYSYVEYPLLQLCKKLIRKTLHSKQDISIATPEPSYP